MTRPDTTRATRALRRVMPQAKRAARDRRLRRHLRSSARHLGLATSQMARSRRKGTLIDAVTDRRALSHLTTSGSELRKAGGRLRRPRRRLRNAVLLVGPAVAAASFLRRGGKADAGAPAGLGAQGPLHGDVATGGDPHAGMPGGHLARELAEREEGAAGVEG